MHMIQPWRRLKRGAPARSAGSVRRLGMIVLVALFVGGCGEQNDKGRNNATHLVELVLAERTDMQYQAELGGSLRALRAVTLYSEAEGRVLRVAVREGDPVRKGQLLLALDGRLISAELDKAVAARKQAQLNYRQIQQLAPQQLVSANDVAQVRTKLEIAVAEERMLRTRLGFMYVRAPFRGTIAARHAEPGDVVAKHAKLLMVVDNSELVMEVSVSELLLPHLRRGGRAEVRIDALGEAVHAGRIVRIHPTVDPLTRLGRIEVGLKPVPRGARAGQFSRVALYGAKARPLTIPFAALRRDEEGEFVWRADKEMRAQRISVRSGLRFADRIEILSGIEAGDRLVAKGFLGLAADKLLKDVSATGPKEGAGAETQKVRDGTKAGGDRKAP